MAALAVSIFEDEQDNLHIQALYSSHLDAEMARNQLGDLRKLEHFITQLPDEDWIAKSQAGLPPVKAGRFWVYGSHDSGKIPDEVPWPIKIDAGAAFGTGHHGTTKGCLLIFDDLLHSGFHPTRILDLGCGAGTLAIAAAKALSTEIRASDIDADAVSVTQQNAEINDVGNLINAFQADGLEDIPKPKFDLIFANILAGPLVGLAPDIFKVMALNSHVILSGILDEQVSNVSRVFHEQGLKIQAYPSLSGWTSLLGIKPG